MRGLQCVESVSRFPTFQKNNSSLVLRPLPDFFGQALNLQGRKSDVENVNQIGIAFLFVIEENRDQFVPFIACRVGTPAGVTWEKQTEYAMATITLQVRKVKKLPTGKYNVQVSLVSTHVSDQNVPASEAILECGHIAGRHQEYREVGRSAVC